jgi:hypothetical protein
MVNVPPLIHTMPGTPTAGLSSTFSGAGLSLLPVHDIRTVITKPTGSSEETPVRLNAIMKFIKANNKRSINHLARSFSRIFSDGLVLPEVGPGKCLIEMHPGDFGVRLGE